MGAPMSLRSKLSRPWSVRALIQAVKPATRADRDCPVCTEKVAQVLLRGSTVVFMEKNGEVKRECFPVLRGTTVRTGEVVPPAYAVYDAKCPGRYERPSGCLPVTFPNFLSNLQSQFANMRACL
jgi:hypothetical protein